MAGNGRIGNTKARTGCLTCKKRKLKCDERKPACIRCENSQRHCEGYPHLFAALQKPPFASISYPLDRLLSTFKATSNEWQAYDFYINRACPNIGGSLDHDFWHDLVLRFAQDQCSVRFAVFALGHLCRHATVCQSDHCHCEHYRSAIKYYNRSIVSLNNSGRDQSIVLLLTCALFTCLEAMLGHQRNAIELIQKGYQIAAHLLSSPDGLTVAVSRLFERIRLLAILYGQPLSNPNNSCPSTDFTTLSQARHVLYSLMNDSIDFVRDATTAKWQLDSGDKVLVSLRLRRLELKTAFEMWVSQSASLSPRIRSTEGFAVLEALCAVATLWLINAMTRPEFMSGLEHGYFSTVIDKASQFLQHTGKKHPSFVFEMNWIPSLYFVGIKCRDPILRRTAASLLSSTARREGIWHQMETLALVNRVIQLEEGSGRLLYSVDSGLQYIQDGTRQIVAVYSWPLGDDKQWMVMSETLLLEDPFHPSTIDSQLCQVESWSESLRLRNDLCSYNPHDREKDKAETIP